MYKAQSFTLMIPPKDLLHSHSFCPSNTVHNNESWYEKSQKRPHDRDSSLEHGQQHRIEHKPEVVDQ